MGKGKDGVSLADARLKAADARKKLAEGKDPAAERQAEAVAGTTFGEFADAFLESIKAGFKGKNAGRLGARCEGALQAHPGHGASQDHYQRCVGYLVADMDDYQSHSTRDAQPD